MKRTRFNSFRRRAFYLLGTLTLCAVLYILSFGPATAWVVSAVSGRLASEFSPATYDARLNAYKSFYKPLLNIRMWLFWRSLNSQGNPIYESLEEFIWHYEDLFARPAKLADGRQVFTTVGPGPHLHESTTAYVARTVAFDDPASRPGTVAYDLPLSHRVLIIFAPDENELIRTLLDTAIEHSATPYADLKIP